MNSGKITVAFGPSYPLPSIDWVSKDVAEELKDTMGIEFFRAFDEGISSDIIIVTKIMPPLKWVIWQKKQKRKVIYIPVDFFYEPESIKANSCTLQLFDGLATHNEWLTKNLINYNENIFPIDHYLKYKLREPHEYKTEGDLLWIGHSEYISSLLKLANDSNLSKKIIALTDLQNLDKHLPVIKEELAIKGIRLDLNQIEDSSCIINNIRFQQWTPKRQENAMLECRAAFDTKINNFRHSTKPPTKAQKYIFNSIPFACEKDSYAYEYLNKLGLKVPSVKEPERWLSINYFNEINKLYKSKGHLLTLTNVANEYKKIIHTVDDQSHKTHNFSALYIKSLAYRFEYFLFRANRSFWLMLKLIFRA